MNLRIYLIVEEGADRVYVCGTAYPAWYVRPKDRRAEIVAVDIPLPDVEVDRVVKLGPDLVRHALVPEPPEWDDAVSPPMTRCLACAGTGLRHPAMGGDSHWRCRQCFGTGKRPA